MLKKYLIAFVLVTASSAAAAGRSGLAFLKISTDARSAAMGSAAVAGGTDAATVFWNPAGLACLTKRQATLSYSHWIQDIDHSVAAFAMPTRFGHFGLSAILTEVPGLERRDSASAVPLAEFSAQDFTIGLAYARKFSHLSFGIQAKYLYEKIHVESADGFAVDMGVRYLPQIEGLAFAASMQNLGWIDELSNERIDLPRIGRVGVTYSPGGMNGFRWALALDFVKIVDEESHVHAGAEVQLMEVLFLRTGYGTGYDEKSWSAGLGLGWGAARVDYAYVPFSSDLGSAQQFSLTVLF
ncbi:MAG TPA: PorV/PorQ family protein [bacterium]|nr:PorV/PorQ family protein [bacterium]HPG44416.1 PorV/PorQ family protein [bacterium]HPM96974.1 PorV/PorQ family protein [bacterium]